VNISTHTIDIDPTLIQNIYGLKDSVLSKKRSNRGGWQSPFYKLGSHDWATPTIDQVMQAANHSLAITYWFNVNGTNHFNDWHDHGDFGERTSGCLYIQVPSDSGDIEFKHGKHIRSIQPTSGMLILFADNIKHRVLVNKSNDDRITMAFNCWKM